MPTFPHPLPTTGPDSVTVALARQVGRLLGSAFSAPDGSLMAADLLAIGYALKQSRETNSNVLRNAFVSSAKELLGELEALYGVAYDPTLTDDQRRMRLVVKVRASAAGTPPNIITALTPYDLGQPVEVAENSWADVTADPRQVFRFAVRVKPDNTSATTFDGRFSAPRLAAIRETLEQMKPAHTDYSLTSTPMTGFLTDDPSSLTDDTVLAS